MSAALRKHSARNVQNSSFFHARVLTIGLACLYAGSGITRGDAQSAHVVASSGNATSCILVNGRNLQRVIDEAPLHSTILCDPNQQITLSTPIKITKALTLIGLHAALPPKLGKTSLVIVTAKGVVITDFELTGNGDSVSQEDRAPLMAIGASDFRVERGRFFNSSKDGMMIDGDVGDGHDIVGGVVRDIVGRDVIRDTVSISGSGGGVEGGHIKNVLVDNVRCYHSARRGCVEVSDGTDNITVRNVYAEASLYVIDVQDHRKKSQVNRNVLLEDIYAVRCKHAIRTDNIALGHTNLTVRDITAMECTAPIQISNTDRVTLSNARIIDHGSVDLEKVGVFSHKGPSNAIFLKNCHGVNVRDVSIENTNHKGPAVMIEDCDQVIVDGVNLHGGHANLGSGLCFRLATDQKLSGLHITNVFATDVPDGILLETGGKQKETFSDYIISGNIAKVVDHIQGQHALISGNLP